MLLISDIEHTYSRLRANCASYASDEQIRSSSDNAEVKFVQRSMKRAQVARVALI